MAHRWFMPWHRGTHGLLPWSLLCVLCARGEAQFFGLGRSEVIKDARILCGDGRVIEKGSISLKGDRIEDLGPEVQGGLLSKSYDASGKTVTPGFIDVWSRLGVVVSASRSTPQGRAQDAWDGYAADVFADALRNGVTTVYVGPRGPAGILGLGAVVTLADQGMGRVGAVLKEDAALHVQMGSGQSPVARIATFNALRRQFREAREYRKAVEDYKEELEEYEKKIKERADKQAKEEAEKKAKEGDKPEGGKKEGEKKESQKKENGPAPEKGPSPKPKEDPPKPKGPADDGHESRDVPDVSAAQRSEAERRLLELFAEPAPKPAEPPAGGEKKDAKEEEIKKPAEPKPDRDKELLLKALDRKLPLRVEAHRSEDILNALELAAEFKLDMILEGATEAHLVADAIADAKVAVVLGTTLRPDLRENNEYRRHAQTNAEALTRAGVRWMVGSGAGSVASGRFVYQNAQLAAAALSKPTSPLEWVTRQAADFLELAHAGRLARGHRADLVVWSGDPSDPASKVERVYVAGKVVYEALQGS